MRTHRSLALIATIVLPAGLAVITSTAPAAAQPTCDGRLVTITDNGPGDQNGAVGMIEGTNGPDVILGTSADDSIYSFGGNDRVCGGDGNDHIHAGDGNDRVFGGSGNDDLVGGEGNDRVYGGGGNDRIAGHGGDDRLFGFAGNDRIKGDSGQDFVKGGRGADSIRGGKHDDILQGNAGTDWIFGGAGFDRIDGGRADDDCSDGPRLRRCERADLRTLVICPESAPQNTVFTCKVRVKNLGPDATTYRLGINQFGNTACSDADAEFEQAALRPGRTRTRSVRLACGKVTTPHRVFIEAYVWPDARDPKGGIYRDRLGQVRMTD